MENGNAPKTANFNKSILIHLQALALAVICWFLVPGCKDTGTENLPSTTKLDSLTLVFSNNYTGGSPYWVYFRPNDTSEFKVFKLNGDQTVHFGIMKTSEVTFGVVLMRPSGTTNNIYFYSYTGVPAGIWNFKANSGLLINKLTGIITYPLGKQDFTTFASPGGFGITSITPSNRATSTFVLQSVSLMPIGNGFAYYGCTSNLDSNKALSGWALDQPAAKDTIRMTLGTPMKKIQITTDKVLTNAYLYGYTTSQMFSIMLNASKPYPANSTTVPIYVPQDGLTMERYQFYMTSTDSLNSRYYYVFDTPESHTYTFPSTNISYSYNYNRAQFENILVTGEADDLIAGWRYINTAKSTYYYHLVYAANNSTSIKQPEIPASILSELELNQSSFAPYYIMMRNYDTFQDRNSMYKAIFQSTKLFVSQYNRLNTVYRYMPTVEARVPSQEQALINGF